MKNPYKILHLLHLLSEEPQSMEGLAQKLQISRRSVERRFATLHECNFTLRSGKHGQRNYWSLDNSAYARNLDIALEEMAELQTGHLFSGSYAVAQPVLQVEQPQQI